MYIINSYVYNICTTNARNFSLLSIFFSFFDYLQWQAWYYHISIWCDNRNIVQDKLARERQEDLSRNCLNSVNPVQIRARHQATLIPSRFIIVHQQVRNYVGFTLNLNSPQILQTYLLLSECNQRAPRLP